MTGLADLAEEILAVTTAIGLTSGTGSNATVNPDFFQHPLAGEHPLAGGLATILTTPAQRVALLDALDRLLPPQAPRTLPASDARQHHPLLQGSDRGQLYLTIETGHDSGGDRVDVGIAAELRSGAAPAGPALTVELPLVRVSALAGGGAGTLRSLPDPSAPLRLALRVPLGSGRALTAAVAIGGAGNDRYQVEIDDGIPIVFDSAPGSGGTGAFVANLLVTLAGQLATPPAVLTALGTLLGLGHGLPPLPLGELSRDPLAMRRWLYGLTTTVADDGRPALLAWLDGLATLLDATLNPAPNPASAALQDSGGPLELVVLAPTSSTPGLSVTAAVDTAAASTTPVLLLGISVRMPAPAARATVAADAELVAIPLSGTERASVLGALNLVVTAPAGSGPLLPPTSVNGDTLAVAGLRAGLRHAAGQLRPILELNGVRLAGQDHPRLDLTDAGSLTAAARDALTTAIRTGIGSSAQSPVAGALLTLLGLADGAGPGVDLTLLATAPTRAIAGYYRRLRATKTGWSPVLAAVAALLGEPAGVAVGGSGTVDDPWQVTLTRFPQPAGALPELQLVLWDAAASGDPTLRLRLGLRVAAGSTSATVPAPWSVAARAALLAVDLPSAADGTVRWLGEVAATVDVTPPAVDGLLTMGRVSAGVTWNPGSPLRASATLHQVTVTVDGQAVNLGDLTLPATGFHPSDPALGFPVNGDQLWAAARLLLASVARAWGGPATRSRRSSAADHRGPPGCPPSCRRWACPPPVTCSPCSPSRSPPCGPGSPACSPTTASRPTGRPCCRRCAHRCRRCSPTRCRCRRTSRPTPTSPRPVRAARTTRGPCRCRRRARRPLSCSPGSPRTAPRRRGPYPTWPRSARHWTPAPIPARATAPIPARARPLGSQVSRRWPAPWWASARTCRRCPAPSTTRPLSPRRCAL